MKRHLKKLKYAVALVGVVLTAVIAVPGANSTYICGETTKCLRIIYGGNFMGNIAPCG